MTVTKQSTEKFRVAQRAMEREMLGITIRDRKTNDWIRSKTKVKDVVTLIAERRWRWAGHIARMNTGRKLQEWRPRPHAWSRGRPPKRWKDDIVRHADHDWIRKAQDRQE